MHVVGSSRPRRERGFTLIELLIVILVVTLLAIIVIPTFLGAKNNAQNTEARVDMRTAITAVKSTVEADDSFPVADEIIASERTIPWQVTPMPDIGKIGLQRIDGKSVLLTARSKGDLAMLCTVTVRLEHVCEESKRESEPVVPRDPGSDDAAVPTDRYINLLQNPSFENADISTGYAFTICGPNHLRDGVIKGCTGGGGHWAPQLSASSDAPSGAQSMEVLTPPVDYDDYFYIQSNARQVNGITTRKFYARTKIRMLTNVPSHSMRLQCRWDKPDGLYHTERDIVSKQITPSQGWVDLEGLCAENTPPGAAFVRWAIRVRNGSPDPVRFSFRIDEAMIAANAGSNPVPYFDGDTPGAFWTADPHNSRSERPRL